MGTRRRVEQRTTGARDDVCADRDGRPGCGAPIRLVLVIPVHPIKGQPRKYIPLDPTYDPACGIRPSHAVSAGWTTCRPLTADDPTPDPTERPALTHFATCPNRRPSTATTTGATP